MAERIPESEWEWYGHAAHFLCSYACRWHLATVVGEYLISSVGAWVPAEGTMRIDAEARGISLKGRGDDLEADYLKRLGYREVGLGRKFETMVFRVGEERCQVPSCMCGQPIVSDWCELAVAGSNDESAARTWHMALCERAATVGFPEHEDF